MSADAYLLLILAGLTVLLITMQPVVWVAWGVAFALLCLRLAFLTFQLLKD